MFCVFLAEQQGAIFPMEFRAVRIQSLVGEKSNSRSVLAENRECIIKMIFTIEERNVWRPQFFGRRTFLLDPVRNVIKDISAPLPYVKIRRAADRQFAVANRS